ncbi:hypothetical protein SK128_004759 [Halocaridina rubra]|uniref:CUB domain-containing protein n=1 Tax=Halocaridina rubra TaxID=373956 RepID=A0AAN8WY41_HALRR
MTVKMEGLIYFWSSLLLSLCVYTTSIFTKGIYDTYELESFGLCSDGKEESSVYIIPWKSVILKVGHKLEKDGSQASHRIHKCKIRISTQEEFGLVAVIEDMKLRGKRNKNNGWDCEGDYVQLSTLGTSTFAKILDRLLPGDLFKSKKTEELCGVRVAGSPRFSEVGTSANVLSTLSNNLEVEFHQKQNTRHFINNSFSIVVTTFKHESQEDFTESCRGRHMCSGNQYCIHPDYVCDGHLNCALPSGGNDESTCPVTGVSHQPMFSATTTIIMTLASIVGVGLVVCCLFTIIMRAKSRNSTPSGTPVPPSFLSGEATAPPLERQNTLPHYEAVVMSDMDGEQKVKVSLTPQQAGEYPPTYDELYPDGPPQIQDQRIS